MAARFPERRDDGTFVVAAMFDVDHPEAARVVAERLQLAISERGGPGADRLLSEFTSLPALEHVDEQSVAVLYRGRSDARVWKDWVVMLTRELDQVDGAHFVGFEDRVAGRRHPTWPRDD